MSLTGVRRAFTTVEGVAIHWAETGEGRPLVLLHGLSDSHRTWITVAPLLAKLRRRVIMLDLAGHGLSERPDESYTLEWHSRIVTSFVSALHLQNFDLVGHSYGGGVALCMLLNQKPRVRRLALVAAGGFGREVGLALRLASLPHVVERFGQPFMAIGTRLALNAAGGRYFGEEMAHLAAVNSIPGTARAFARTVRDVIDWRGQHRHVHHRADEVRQYPPVALLWGDRDNVIPFSHAKRAAALFRGTTITRFAGCGHFPHRQCPENFVKALATFLDASVVPRTSLRTRAPAREVAQSALLGTTAPLAHAAMVG